MASTRTLIRALAALACALAALALAAAPYRAFADDAPKGPETVKLFTDPAGSVDKAEVVQDNVEDAEALPVDASKVPVKIRVSYKLDGKDVSADELSGASGALTIRFDYENTTFADKDINGATERIYTPFTAITALLFDSADFKNVTVKNAKVIEDGSSVIIAGYAMPGLKESLGISDDDTEIPDYFEVTADVSDFEMKTALTIVTAGLLSDVDASRLDVSELSESAAALSEAASTLASGAEQLDDGLAQLSDAASLVSDGANQLDAGARAAQAQVADLAFALSQLHAGSSAVAEGADSLEKGVLQAKSGLDEVIAKLDALTASLAGVASGGQPLPAQALAAAVAEAQADADAANAVVTQSAQVGSDIDAALASLESIDRANLDPDAAQQLQSAIASLRSAKQAQGSMEASAGGITTQSLDALSSLDVQAGPDLAGLIGGIGELKAALQKISDGLGDEGLHGGAVKLADGAAQVDAGLAALEGRSGPLQAGIDALAAGTGQLSAGTAELAKGAEASAEGSSDLASGMRQFEREGVGAIVELVDGRLASMSARMKATIQAGKDYTSFTGDSTDVKFVYETSGISR